MPILRNHNVFELFRGLKAFVSLDLGLTRGEVRDPQLLERQVQSLKQQLQAAKQQSANLSRQPDRFREQSSQKPGSGRREIEDRDELIKQMQLRLAEKDSRIKRLQNGILVQTDEEPGPSEADEELMPPEELMRVGWSDKKVFKQVGERQVELFKELAALRPDESILDAGCGIGRIAIPLTNYLSEEGRYEGFDIVSEGIEWCRENISPKYPNFKFQLADVYNKKYHPEGTQRASEYRFPYEDGSFDFLFLTSVFTHLTPEDTKNYLSEISRVLKSGGRCYATFFLLNEESLGLMKTEESQYDFRHDLGEYRTTNKNIPEAAIAYDEGYVRELYEERGLNIESTHYGSWSGRENFLTFQDTLISTKS